MRLGYLTYGLDRAPTGIARYTVELVQAMAQLPNRPEIVLLTTERADRHGLWDMFERHALPGCRRLPSLMTFGAALIDQATRYFRLDMVHDPNGIAPFLGRRAAARRFVTIHDAVAYIYPATHNRLDNWRYRWMLPHAARQADAVMTVSNCSRRDLIRHLHLSDARVHVTSVGVNTRFRPVSDGAERRAALARYGIVPPYLLYIGGLNARKNIARIFEAYAQVLEQYPGFTLVVGGPRQWQTEEIDATFRRLGLANHVHFAGYVEDTDLPALYSGATLFVFPSLYEGFGSPPLEAMACGTPVITSSASSLPEVVGDAALLVDPYDVRAIADAIRRVIDSPSLAADLRIRGLARARQFTWEQVARETLAVYERSWRDRVAGQP